MAFWTSLRRRPRHNVRSTKTHHPLFEILESRILLSASPVGGDFLLHENSQGNQGDPVVDVDAQGNFVAAFNNSDQNGGHVYTRHMESSGVFPQPEHLMGQSDNWHGQDVGMADDGRYIVTGVDFKYDSYRIRAAVLAADDSVVNVMVVATPYIRKSLPEATVGVNRVTGDFVVVWCTDGEVGDTCSRWEIYAQRFSAEGATRGERIHVATSYGDWQPSRADVAMDTKGDFWIAWSGSLDPGAHGRDTANLYVSRFNAQGQAIGDAFLVDVKCRQSRPSIAVDAEGRFCVAWWGDGGVIARGYFDNGTPASRAFRIANGGGVGGEQSPAVAFCPDGQLAVTWVGTKDSHWDVYAGCFRIDGTPVVEPWRVNETEPYQYLPAVAAGPERFLIVWTNLRDMPLGGEAYGRLYENPDPLVTISKCTTGDTTPILSGQVADPSLGVTVTIAGKTYSAVNNKDGTWTLASGPYLAPGTYDVHVDAVGAQGVLGWDRTTNELTILPTVPMDASGKNRSGAIVIGQNFAYWLVVEHGEDLYDWQISAGMVIQSELAGLNPSINYYPANTPFDVYGNRLLALTQGNSKMGMVLNASPGHSSIRLWNDRQQYYWTWDCDDILPRLSAPGWKGLAALPFRLNVLPA